VLWFAQSGPAGLNPETPHGLLEGFSRFPRRILLVTVWDEQLGDSLENPRGAGDAKMDANSLSHHPLPLAKPAWFVHHVEATAVAVGR
jgi:hypothetical protein